MCGAYAERAPAPGLAARGCGMGNADGTGERGQRRFLPPWWTVFFPVLVMAGVAAWEGAKADSGAAGAFFSGLVWPGLGAFALVAVIVWLGWVLDID